VLYSSVYQNNKVLLGVSSIAFRIEDEIQEVLSIIPDTQLLIKIEDQNQLLFSNFPTAKSVNILSLQKTSQIKVADRTWTITFQPSDAFYHNQLSWVVWWILLGGFVLTGITSIGLLMLSGRTLRTEQQVRERTQALSESEEHFRELVQAQSAIVWRADPNTFKFTFVSDEAEKILGFPVERWLNDPDFWVSQMHKDDRLWAPEFCKSETSQLKNHTFEYRIWGSFEK
jgi:PAS domain-containing protein